MPNQFTLTRKSAPEDGPVKFAKIDDEMCEHFGVEPHPKKYFRNWYNAFSDLFVMGKSWGEIREFYREQYYSPTSPEGNKAFYKNDVLPMINWLEENFVLNAWYSH